jgi:5-methylcytosine-specific restriction protein A
MGPIGPQSLTYSQNKTLTQSAQFGTTLHLLEALSEQKYTYVGEVSLAGPPYQEEQPDRSGTLRPVWMFPLQLGFGNHPPEPSLEQVKRIEASQAAVAKTLTLEQLKALAAKSNKSPTRRSAESQVYDRNAAVAELTKRLANGICDLCLKPAPFLNKRNEAYLECHHIHWLAQGGDDAVANTVALCPNCHRKMHILNSVADRNQLQKRAEARDLN